MTQSPMHPAVDTRVEARPRRLARMGLRTVVVGLVAPGLIIAGAGAAAAAPCGSTCREITRGTPTFDNPTVRELCPTGPVIYFGDSGCA